MNAKRCNVAVLASGSGTNFRAIARACQREDFPARVACLVTDNAGAGALDIARSFEIPAHIVAVDAKRGRLPAEAEMAIIKHCKDAGADLIALAGFMRIVKRHLLDAFKGRVLNIHPSLLPSFKGLHAVRQALEYGSKVTGVTVHFVDDTIDGGPIIVQDSVRIADDDDEDSLFEKVHALEHELYSRAIEVIALDKITIDGRRVRVR